MGIDKNRFIGDHHQVFLCPVCKNVSSNPILSSCCESTFCDECWTSTMCGPSDKCPSCGQKHDPFIEKKSFQKQLTLVYNNLSMKCLERACGQTLTISTYTDHDATCMLRKYHCYKCGYKGKMLDSKGHDCVRWLKQERNQMQDKVMELTVKLKQAQKSTSNVNSINVPIHDEEVDRVIKENAELKKRIDEISLEKEKLQESLNEAIKEKIHLQDTFNSTVKLLNASYTTMDKKSTNLVNGHADKTEISKAIGPRTETVYCMLATSSAPSSSTSSLSTPPSFTSNLPTIPLPKESELKRESKVVFVEEATKARNEVKNKVKSVVVEVFKSNSNQGLNIQRKCLEVSKELKKSLTGSWYTFPRNHFNPQGFRPFINTFCLFYYDGRYYVSFQNNGPVEEKTKFLNHYLRFK